VVSTKKKKKKKASFSLLKIVGKIEN